MSKYSFDGQIVERDDPLMQDLLDSAYKTKKRPLCLCSDNGIEMYIAKSGDSNYILKRLPYSAQRHHPDCDSFEIPAELSGREDVQQKAISEDEATGLTSLKFDFSLSKMAINSSMNKGEPKEKTAVQANPTKLSIRSLLHFLYEEAGLNKWSPKMTGKRNWWIVRKYIIQAAQDKVARKKPLEKILLVPENFSIDNKDEIISRRRQFLSTLKKQGSKSPMGASIFTTSAPRSAIKRAQ